MPCVAKQSIETVHAPDREQVRRVAATHIEDILFRYKVRQTRREQRIAWQPGQVVENEVRGDRASGERPIEPGDVPSRISAGGRDEADARRLSPRERQYEVFKEQVIGIYGEATSAHRDD